MNLDGNIADVYLKLDDVDINKIIKTINKRNNTEITRAKLPFVSKDMVCFCLIAEASKAGSKDQVTFANIFLMKITVAPIMGDVRFLAVLNENKVANATKEAGHITLPLPISIGEIRYTAKPTMETERRVVTVSRHHDHRYKDVYEVRTIPGAERLALKFVSKQFGLL